MKLALVVPCYDEEEVLEDTTKQLCKLFDKLLEKGKTDLIKGFKSKAGNEFDAYLILKDDKTTGFEFPPRKK